MDKLIIKDLVLWGKHGITGYEPDIAQPFKFDISASFDFTSAFKSDDLKDTIDYKDLEKIATNVVEGKHHVLLETLACDIADTIMKETNAEKVKIEITKIKAKTRSTPVISIEKCRTASVGSGLLSFGAKEILNNLDKYGGVSLPVISENFRKELFSEALTYEYHKQPEVVGKGLVREEISSSDIFPYGSLFFKLKESFESSFLKGLANLDERNVFEKGLRFNEMSLQHYEKDSIGITPHMDGRSMINLICVFILKGESKFALCDDRSAANPYYLDTTPGNVIIMRGPGFRGSDFRPFHFVTDIASDRIVFGLRQVVRK